MDGRFTADWEGHDSDDTSAEDSVGSFTGTMLGEFCGPAGEDVAAYCKGIATTPEQIFNGFFSAGREPDAEQ